MVEAQIIPLQRIMELVDMEVSSEMQRALQLFPQWDQATIQGYFDMGWSIEQLQDWVRDNG